MVKFTTVLSVVGVKAMLEWVEVRREEEKLERVNLNNYFGVFYCKRRLRKRMMTMVLKAWR